MPWNKNVQQLLREARWSLVRFQEDGDVEELFAAQAMLADIAESVEDLVMSAPPAEPSN